MKLQMKILVGVGILALCILAMSQSKEAYTQQQFNQQFNQYNKSMAMLEKNAKTMKLTPQQAAMLAAWKAQRAANAKPMTPQIAQQRLVRIAAQRQKIAAAMAQMAQREAKLKTYLAGPVAPPTVQPPMQPPMPIAPQVAPQMIPAPMPPMPVASPTVVEFGF